MEAASTASSAASSVDGRSGAVGSTDYLTLGMFSTGGSMAQGDILGAGSTGFLNGFGNATDSSNQVSSAPGASFDLSEFPSLGGTGSINAANAPGNGLAAALRQQQQLLAHQQMIANSKQQTTNLYRLAMSGTATNNFNLDDFPALGGSGGGGVPAGAGGGGVSSLLPSSSVASRGQAPNAAGLYGSVVAASATDMDSNAGASQLSGDSGAGGLLVGAGLGGIGGLRGLQQPGLSTNAVSLQRSLSSTNAAPSAVGTGSTSGGGSAAGNALTGDYGLLGLLGVIRMTDADRNALALGSDLTLLGVNLGSAEQIYSTFSSPWSEGSVASKEPHYQLPVCYYMQPPALKTGHLSKFQLETLFYIFYALPKDVLQAYSAQELYAREWRYHGELKLWFKRAGPADGYAPASAGSTQYLYFDINSWERRLFNGSMNQNITSGFLQEEDVRVKFASA